MKNFTILLLTLLNFYWISGLKAQHDSLALGKFYQTWIIPEKGLPAISGIMYELKDSAVLLSTSYRKIDYYNGNYDVSKVDIRKIHEIKVRRKGKGIALLVGGVSGLSVGCLISYFFYKNKIKATSVYSIVEGGLAIIAPVLVSTGIGIGIGAFAAAKTTIPIHGKQAAYEQNKLRLSEYALKKNSTQLVFDADGNPYRTIFLCGRLWMAEDLKVTKFHNGEPIPIITGNEEWNLAATGAMSWFLDDAARKISQAGLYNASAVSDPRGLCPQGWHVPTFDEWSLLVSCLRINIPQESGSIISMRNISTFGAPAGYRYPDGSFSKEKSLSWQWWSSTGVDSARTKALYQQSDNGSVFFTETENKTGLPVRCIRD